MIRISLITDELSGDPETAIEMAVGWGIRHFELRGFFTDRVPRLSAYQKHQLRCVLDDYSGQIIALAPGLFKIAYPPRAAARWSFGCLDAPSYESWEAAHRSVQVHLHELLPAALDYAAELGAGKIIIFSFDRAGAPPGSPPDEVLDILRLAAERAASAGMVLAVETEEGFWADTGARSAALIKAVNHPALRLNWDPGNSFCAGDTPFPTGYEAVKGIVEHVHFKDARRLPDGSAEFVIDGQIDWQGQISALVKDGYDGFISIETHQRPKIAAARASFERLKALIEAGGG